MSDGMTVVAVTIPAWLALAVACWPVGLRLRVSDYPVRPGERQLRALVLAAPRGGEWFICKIPSKDSE